MTPRHRSVLGLAVASVVATGIGVWLAYTLELALLGTTSAAAWALAVGFIEEAFVRLVPLVLIFYAWSYRIGELLSKTEGLLATVVSGLTVAGLELVVKLEYLARLEETARFDSLVLPILFVHLPFALLAGRFAYALGERVHGIDAVGVPSLSRRTVGLLLVGYLVLAFAHVGYNLFV
jgi:hypothetical protein